MGEIAVLLDEDARRGVDTDPSQDGIPRRICESRDAGVFCVVMEADGSRIDSSFGAGANSDGYYATAGPQGCCRRGQEASGVPDVNIDAVQPLNENCREIEASLLHIAG
jgi:hypothetical protein